LRHRALSPAPLRASVDRAEEGSDGEGEGLIGEDSAVFRLGDQRVLSWAYFSGIDPNTGFGTSFLDAVGSISYSHEVRPSTPFSTTTTNPFIYSALVPAAI
jgi:hypothetical protein